MDPQIDPYQQSLIEVDFTPLDVPKSRFLVAGQAWRQCRTGERDPEQFGIACPPEEFGLETLYGLWFVRGNLLRDLAALNKVETVPFLMRLDKGLPWDAWRLVALEDIKMSASEYALLDTVAEWSLDPDMSFQQMRALYESHLELQPPADVLINH